MLPPETLSSLRQIAAEIACEAGTLIHDMRMAGAEVDATKSSVTDIVTPADHRAEELIVERLRALRPDDGIFAEEGHSAETQTGITWVIDPIDGTVNYLYNLPSFCVSIAATIEDPRSYADGRRAVAAAVYAPRSDELFEAACEQGATRNGQPIHALPPKPLSQSLIATGFGYTRERRLEQHELLGRIIGKVRDIRRLGSAAYDLCLLASGRIDGYFEKGIQPWDWAAAALIATEAGAVTLGLDEHSPAGEKMFIAGAPQTALALQRLIRGDDNVPLSLGSAR